MILRTNTRAVIYPEALNRPCTRAEHAVAVQAERDTRRFVPSASGKLRSSGKVYGNRIVWNTPYARLLYFGNVYADPKYKKAGFKVKQRPGEFVSRPGVRKKRTNRKLGINRGSAVWFTESKKRNLEKWVRLAEEAISRG